MASRSEQSDPRDFLDRALEQPHPLRTPHAPVMALLILPDSLESEVFEDNAIAGIQGEGAFVLKHVPMRTIGVIGPALDLGAFEQQSMRLDCCGIPPLRFDLAMGRPVVADFRAKCAMLVERASAE